jgi:hypothetical protein
MPKRKKRRVLKPTDGQPIMVRRVEENGIVRECWFYGELSPSGVALMSDEDWRVRVRTHGGRFRV